MSTIDPINLPGPNGYPFPQMNVPLTNITPFTERDSATYLSLINDVIDYLNTTLVPGVQTAAKDLGGVWDSEYKLLVDFVNSVQAGISDNVTAAQAAEAAAEAAQEFAQNAAAQAGNQQDIGVTTLFNNLASAFRTALNNTYANKATQTTQETGRLSPETMATYALKSYVDQATAQVENDLNGVAGRVTTLETERNTGRLGQVALDTRYQLVPPAPHAVFIGSSQSVPGTWPETFCQEMGYVCHNYSIGGGSFTGAGPGAFLAQINTAIADNSYDKNLVKFFYLIDLGNDIRALANTSNYIAPVLAAAKQAYPNARIIVLPCLWGWATDNNIGARIYSIEQRMQELRLAGNPFNIEIVEWSWLWMADARGPAWMKQGEVHYTAEGYARVKDYMKTYMKGGSTRYDMGGRAIQPSTNLNSFYAYWTARRKGNQVFITNSFVTNVALGVDSDLGQLDYGLYPIVDTFFTVIGDADRAPHTCIIFGNDSSAPGLIRTFGALNQDRYHIAATYDAF